MFVESLLEAPGEKARFGFVLLQVVSTNVFCRVAPMQGCSWGVCKVARSYPRVINHGYVRIYSGSNATDIIFVPNAMDICVVSRGVYHGIQRRYPWHRHK